MTNKINMLEHDNNVLAFENINLQIKLTRLEDELKNEKARVRVLRKCWDQTTRDLIKAEGQVEYGRKLFRHQASKTVKLRGEIERLDHALNAANQALYNRD
jgi:hypothetical protein